MCEVVCFIIDSMEPMGHILKKQLFPKKTGFTIIATAVLILCANTLACFYVF